MSRVGVGIVGVGFGQQVHIPAFRGDERCEVVALAATDAEKARAVAGKLGVPAAYGDWRQLIADPRVQVVSIAVPPAQQPAIAIAAARAGKHLFCEKPSASNVDDAATMLHAAEEARVAHSVDLLFPEIPTWRLLKQMLDEGRVGALRHAALTWRVEIYAVKNKLDNWKTREDAGGGTLLSFASHSVYYLEWLFGPISEVTCRLSPRDGRGEVRVDAWLEFASGLQLNLAIAADAFLGSGHRLEVYGETGTLVLENATRDYVSGFRLMSGTRGDQQLNEVADGRLPEQTDGRVMAMGSIVQRFLSAVTGGPAVRPNLADGLRVQQVLAAFRDSDRHGARQVVRA